MAAYSQYKNLELPVGPEHYDIAVFNKNSMVIDSELHKLDLKNESQDNLLATKEALNSETTRASNRENEISVLISGLTTNKVNVSDIIDSLTSTAVDKPLSANQGKILNDSVITLTTAIPTKTSELINDSGYKTTDNNTYFINDGSPDPSLQELGITGTDTVQEVFSKLPNGISIICHNSHTGNYTESLPISAQRGQLIYCKTGTRGYIEAQFFDNNLLYVASVLEGVVNSFSKVSFNNGISYSETEPTSLASDMTWIGN